MHIEDYRNYCLRKPEVSEGFPFNETTLVFKVAGKMFALTDIECFDSINLKCDPERAVELRESYGGIRPGWHMNKTNWNTVEVHSDVPDELIYELIDHSYEQVVAGLPKKVRDGLQNR